MKLVFCFLLTALYAAPAWAYIDPGTGSMIVQSIIGAAVTAMVALGFYWNKVKTFLFRNRARPPKKAE